MDKTAYENKGGALFVTLKNVRSVALHGIQPDQEIRTPCDHEGTPLDLHYRRRINDRDFVPVTKKKKKGGKK